MDRKDFLKSCCAAAVGIPLGGLLLQSCGSIYYASSTVDADSLVIDKNEFLEQRKSKTVQRKFVLLKVAGTDFPICLYRVEQDAYVASLLRCTHRGCELNVGGGIYSCPCHGSEFSTHGKVLQGPAEESLQTFTTTTDNDHIYIKLR